MTPETEKISHELNKALSAPPAPRQTMYEMTSEILQLHTLRENAEYEGDSLEVERLDAELRRYLHETLPAKVDGIRGYVREQENAERVHAAEAELQTQLAKQARGNVARVKAMCLEVMQHFGQKVYKGALHTIRRCGNGGLRPVEIRQPELLPAAFKIVRLEAPLNIWLQIKSEDWSRPLPLREWPPVPLTGIRESEPEPNTALIRAALEAGEAVPGCVLAERGEHARFS